MGRKKKLINKTDIPQYAVERFARCVFDDIRAAYADQEVQAEFARWQAQRAELNTKKKRAAVVAALSVYVVFFLRGPLGLESGRMGAPLGKQICSYLLKQTNNPNPFPTGKIWFGLYWFGAGNRNRTGTLFRARDFKSLVSTYSTMPAQLGYRNTIFRFRQDESPPMAGFGFFLTADPDDTLHYGRPSAK